jgi:hypothetical protein
MYGSYANISVQIELGNMAGSASTPAIDFHSGATLTDYDTRILSDTPTGVAGGGILRYIANGGHAFTGSISTDKTIYATQTINAVGGLYDVGSRVWSAATFDPTLKMTVMKNGITNQYGYIYAPNYQNLSASNQAYNSPIMIGEANLVATGGPAPGHIFNAPGITFLWNGYVANKIMMNTSGSLCWGNPNAEYFQHSTDGNIFGNAFGGWLTTWLSTYYLQKGNTMLQMAQLSDCTAVGGIALMKNVSGGAIGLNVLAAYYSIAWSDTTMANYGQPAGTWKSMGYVANGATGIFMRVS